MNKMQTSNNITLQESKSKSLAFSPNFGSVKFYNANFPSFTTFQSPLLASAKTLGIAFEEISSLFTPQEGSRLLETKLKCAAETSYYSISRQAAHIYRCPIKAQCLFYVTITTVRRRKIRRRRTRRRRGRGGEEGGGGRGGRGGRGGGDEDEEEGRGGGGGGGEVGGGGEFIKISVPSNKAVVHFPSVSFEILTAYLRGSVTANTLLLQYK